MSRTQLAVPTILLAVVLVIAGGIASTAATAPRTQDTSDTAAGTPTHPTVTPLAGIVAGSTAQPWVTEVRIPVVIENVTDRPLPATLEALGSLAFAMVDAAGDRHRLDNAHPQRAALPNHSVRYLEPGMAARWTIGFRVPTSSATGLILELVDGASVVASWAIDDLGGPVPVADASRMANLTVGLGAAFEWQPGVTVAAAGVGSLLCGDPEIEVVTQVVAVTFEVGNSSGAEVRWPGVLHGDEASVAQWADGTAADVSMETYVGGEESLPRVSTFAVRIPAGTATTRALVFAAPRDGRFADPSTLPSGVMLAAGSGRVWLSLTGAEASVPISPMFCDLGFFGGPVPFGYSPGAKFDVGGSEPAPPDYLRADAAARSAITEALAGAALFYDRNDQTFAGVTGRDLNAQAPRLSFVSHEVGTFAAGTVATIYFALRPGDDQFLYVATRSASGRWFCGGVTPHKSVTASDGYDLTEISTVCFPTSSVDG